MIYTLALTLMSAASALCPTVVPEAARRITTADAAVAAAKLAWRAKFSDSVVQRSEPYRANLHNGSWQVFGTLPAGFRGGTPEAVICASNGQVVKIAHGR